MSGLRADATTDCDECDLPMFPVAASSATLTLECANRHRRTLALPDDPHTRELARNWIAKRGAQLHEQHERWEREAEEQDS